MRITLIAPLLIIIVIGCCLSGTSHASRILHEFEDGYVDRGLAVKFRDQKATFEYSLGLNPNTMKSLLKSWKAKIKAEGKTEPLETVLVENAFRKHVLQYIANNLEVSIQGKKLKLKPISAVQTSRHNVNAIVTLELELKSGQQGELLIKDNCFSELDGSIRYALKAGGRAIVHRSNVVPVLVRAKRIEIGKLTTKTREAKTSLKAMVTFTPKPKKKTGETATISN